MTNEANYNMTRKEAISTIKLEIAFIENGPASETFLGIEINPKDVLPKKYAGLKSLEEMTDAHFEASRQYND